MDDATKKFLDSDSDISDCALRRRVLPVVSLAKGFASFVDKYDALLFQVMLEACFADRSICARGYCEAVICNLSDQGKGLF